MYHTVLFSKLKRLRDGIFLSLTAINLSINNIAQSVVWVLTLLLFLTSVAIVIIVNTLTVVLVVYVIAAMVWYR